MSSSIELTEPLVSVVIPTYNRPEYLKQAIASAVNQTFKNIEIIVCDNCSDISPQPIVEAFQDERIRFCRNSHNIGMVANIINGFVIAKGKYVASLHDDDMWEPDFLAKLVPPLEANSDLALAFCDHYVIKADGQIDDKLTQECSKTWKRADLTAGIHQPFYKIAIENMSVATANAAVIRKDVVDWQAFPLEVGGFYDLYINYLCSRSGLGAYYTPEKLTRYREHELTDTLTDNAQINIRKAKNHIFCYEHFMQDTRLKELYPHFQQRLIEANQYLGMSLLKAGQPESARPHFWYVWQKKKLSVRAIAALLFSFIYSLLINTFISVKGYVTAERKATSG
ncbi:glycosyltransferase family 2 protein [Nostoc sp. FACHB-87]|uniref:glycosyltransferase family 2 protein n=1 Tax=Nostocaceae TaxID=1162 RepID=UPI00168470DC|nr:MULTISPECIES: glycosyltransferase family 2 protein [Nostocaceae]MBD2455190.1 glycosyltransferase family 2 protein [Nostoc sp. FACHB-87]MBD2474268.1 glycosyltransferase family 2 protein [Anabaena sp. FACHB-83]